MTNQILRLAVAIAIAVPVGVTGTAKSSAMPISGASIEAPVSAVTTEARYRVRHGHRYPPHWGDPSSNSYSSYPADSSHGRYPAYSSYLDYPNYNSYYRAADYGDHRSGCLPAPRVGAFATAPWTDTPTCPPY